MTEKNWCEVCQHEEKAHTIKKLMKQWNKHIVTELHQLNVIKYLQYDVGALTIKEIPEKLDKYFGEKNESL